MISDDGAERGDAVDPADYLGLRTLIVGEVNSGKTTMTKTILDALTKAVPPSRTVVIDLAPRIPADLNPSKGVEPAVGGGLAIDDTTDTLYLTASIAAPRLTSSNEEEAFVVARRNEATIEILFERFVASGRDVLFVNDVGLYLHHGTARRLIRWFHRASTVVANGYMGRTLGNGALSRREEREMLDLSARVDRTVRLPER